MEPEPRSYIYLDLPLPPSFYLSSYTTIPSLCAVMDPVATMADLVARIDAAFAAFEEHTDDLHVELLAVVGSAEEALSTFAPGKSGTT